MSIEQHFENRTQEFESKPEPGPEVSFIIDFIQKLEPKKVMEIGCNYGRELKKLEGLAQLYGVDSNEKMVEFAKQYVKGKFLKADVCELPYGNSTMDLVYTDGLLSHLPPEKVYEAVKEIVRVSKKYVLFVEYCGTRQSKNNVYNCKKFTWIHDYNRLVSTIDAFVNYNQNIFLGSDLYHVILLKKSLPSKQVNIVNNTNVKNHKLLIKLGKFELGVG